MYVLDYFGLVFGPWLVGSLAIYPGGQSPPPRPPLKRVWDMCVCMYVCIYISLSLSLSGWAMLFLNNAFCWFW